MLQVLSKLLFLTDAFREKQSYNPLFMLIFIKQSFALK